MGSSPVNIEINESYSDDGATATDNYDDNATLTAQINLSGTVDNTVIGSYTLTYNVFDSSNNQAAPISRVVNVEDKIKPTIDLLGDSTISLSSSNFMDPGATASDNYDNDSSITGLISVSGIAINFNIRNLFVVIYSF